MNRAELISALTLTLKMCVLQIFIFFSVIVGRYIAYVEQFGVILYLEETKNFEVCEIQSKLLMI